MTAKVQPKDALNLLKQGLLELQAKHGRIVHVVVQFDDLGAHKHGGAR